MIKIISLIAVFLFPALVLRSQSVPDKFTDSPLSTALYWYSKEPRDVSKDRLLQILRELGRDDEFFDIINKTANDFEKLENLAFFSKSLSGKNSPRQTALYLSKAVAIIKSSDDQDMWRESSLSAIVSGLIKENRQAEARQIINGLEDDSVKLALMIRAVQTALELRRSQIAFGFLQDAARLADKDESLENTEALSNIAGFYAKFGEVEKALSVLKIIERRLETMPIERAPKTALSLIPVYLRIKQPQKASAVWRKYEQNIDEYDVWAFLRALINFGNFSESTPYLLKIRRNPKFVERNGEELAEIYLRLNQPETAVLIAKTMSGDNDDYNQQKALAKVADWFIARWQNARALEILDFAYRRARRIVYEHRPQDSVGASSGSRKEIYFRQIYERLMELKRFKQAYDVFRSIESEDFNRQEFIAYKLVDFVNRRLSTLPPAQINDLLDEAQRLVKDGEYHQIGIKIRRADIYAKLKEPGKALELLNEALLEAEESCCYEDDLLLEAALVFEKNKLRADTRMREILREYRL